MIRIFWAAHVVPPINIIEVAVCTVDDESKGSPLFPARRARRVLPGDSPVVEEHRMAAMGC